MPGDRDKIDSGIVNRLLAMFKALVVFMLPLDCGPVYRAGRVILTAKARAKLSDNDIATALLRHLHLTWGDPDAWAVLHDRFALLDNCRFLTAYHARNGTWFWILTESQKERTTVLLPDEFPVSPQG